MSAQEKIQNIISSNEVVLFMKGTPDMIQKLLNEHQQMA